MKIIDYFKDSQGELKHVSWPSRKQVVAHTTLVIVISLLVAAYLGAFDALFTYLLKNYIL